MHGGESVRAQRRCFTEVGRVKLCIISSKECWQDSTGAWMSSGGFPLQMDALTSLFDESELVIVRSTAKSGALPLPPRANVVALREPAGSGIRRKLDVILRMPHYVTTLAARAWRADVVHIPLPGDIPLLGLLVASILRKPVIARYGGSWHATGITTVMNRVSRSLMRLLAAGRNLMLATGEEPNPPAPNMQWIFTTALSRQELQEIHPSFERGVNAPARMVYVGRLSSEKGIDVLIRALALLKQADAPLTPFVTLVGDGPARKALEGLVDSLGCRSQVTFAGQVNRRRLSKILIESDFAVQPSLTEGLSKAWLDAMAHGVPLISSAVGAAEAVIGKHEARGWLVPPGSVEILAAQIRNVITAERDWPALRRRCRQYAESRTIEAWAEEIARRCTERWNCSYDHGKLRFAKD